MKKLLSLSLAAAMLLAMLAGCGGDSDTTATPSTTTDATDSGSSSAVEEPDGIVAGTSAVIISPMDFVSLQLPGTFLGGTCVYNLVYDTLFWSPSGDMTDVTGLLVQDWTVSEDNCTWVLNLYEGIEFVNGNPLNAESVVGSMSFRINETGMSVSANITNFEATGEYQVTLTLSAPDADLMNKFSAAHNGIFDYTMYETYGNTVEAAYMASSGPYYISDYGIGDYFTLTAVEDYWNPERQAHIETLTVKVITSTSTSMNSMMAGESDFVSISSYEYYDLFVEDYPNINMLTNDAVSGYKGYWFNSGDTATASEYLSNVRVREALCMLIDNEELAIAISGPYAIIGENAFSGMIPYEEDRVYDPEAALAILEEEGIDPSDIVLEGLCGTVDANAYSNIQSQWMEYGITLNFVAQDNNVTMSAALEQKWDLWAETAAMNVYSMGEAFNTLLGEDAALLLVSDEDLHAEIGDLVEVAFTTMDDDEKLAYLAEICQICDENYLYFGPSASTLWFGFSDRIANPSLCYMTSTWRAYDSWIIE